MKTFRYLTKLNIDSLLKSSVFLVRKYALFTHFREGCDSTHTRDNDKSGRLVCWELEEK